MIKLYLLSLSQFKLQLLCSSRTGLPFLLHDKNGRKSVFKGRNPLLGFLPLNIPSSQPNGASHLQLRLMAQVKLRLTVLPHECKRG